MTCPDWNNAFPKFVAKLPAPINTISIRLKLYFVSKLVLSSSRFRQWTNVHILPFQFILILRLALNGRIPKAYHALSREVFRIAKQETKHMIGRFSVFHKTVAHLTPA